MKTPWSPLITPTALMVLLLAQPAPAQLNRDERACVKILNVDGATVAKLQGLEDVACLKAAGKGTLTGTAQACLTADARSKVTTKKNKTTTDQTNHCTDTPGFAYTSAGTVNAEAQFGELSIVADVFGSDLDAAVVSCSANRAQCKCQQKVLKAVEGLHKTMRKTFVKCKKPVLLTAASALDVAKCVSDPGTSSSIAAETASGGKVDIALGTLGDAITDSCDTPVVTGGSFPGACNGLAGAPLRDCLDHRVACRACRALNETDGLGVDCDAFDDGTANNSCPLHDSAAFVGAMGPASSCDYGGAGGYRWDNLGNLDWRTCVVEASKRGAMLASQYYTIAGGWGAHRNGAAAFTGYWGPAYQETPIGTPEPCIVARDPGATSNNSPLSSTTVYDGNTWQYQDFGPTYYDECQLLAANAGAAIITPYTLGLAADDYWITSLHTCNTYEWITSGGTDIAYDNLGFAARSSVHNCMVGYIAQ